MADDARISTALPKHPKTVKLRRRLGVDGCWSLICLFLWVSDNRPSGDLSGMTDEDIEIAADWNGEPGTFIATLAEVRFVDGEPGSYRIHDWTEHNPYAANRPQRIAQAKEAAEARWRRKKESDAERIHTGCEPDAERMRADENSNALLSSPPLTSPHDATEASCATTSAAPQADTAPSFPPLITLPLNDGSEYPVTKAEADEYTNLYPNVDVSQALRNMRGWLLSHDRKRKTRKGIKAFVTNWLSGEQDRRSSYGGNGNGKQPNRAAEIVERAEQAKQILRGMDRGAIIDAG